MSKFHKLIFKLLSGNSDKNFNFNDVVLLLQTVGFKMRTKGSHHIFYKEDVLEIINLQPKDGKVKPYQLKQVRELLIKYKLIQPDAI